MLGLVPSPDSTSLALALGAALTAGTPDDVLVIGGDDDRDLAARSGTPPAATAFDLAALGDPGGAAVLTGSIRRSADGVWVLPGRGADGEVLDAPTYVEAMNAVYRHYPLIVTACPPQVEHPVSQQVLRGCHSVVLVCGRQEAQLAAAQATLDRLEGGGFPGLAATSIVVPVTARPTLPPPGRDGAPARRSSGLQARALAAQARTQLAAQCWAVRPLRADRAWRADGVLRLETLSRAARRSLTRLAAVVREAAAAAG